MQVDVQNTTVLSSDGSSIKLGEYSGKVIARFKPGVKPFDENLIAAIEVALDS